MKLRQGHLGDSLLKEEVKRLLREVEECAKGARWQYHDVPDEDPTARSYSADAPNWTLLVVSFDIEKQGFPKGSRGYDGTAVRGNPPLIMRLTRELAEKLFKQAGYEVKDLLEEMIAAAENHGQESDDAHEVGDLIEVLRTCWGKLTQQQQREVYNEHKDLVTDWGKS